MGGRRRKMTARRGRRKQRELTQVHSTRPAQETRALFRGPAARGVVAEHSTEDVARSTIASRAKARATCSVSILGCKKHWAGFYTCALTGVGGRYSQPGVLVAFARDGLGFLHPASEHPESSANTGPSSLSPAPVESTAGSAFSAFLQKPSKQSPSSFLPLNH